MFSACAIFYDQTQAEMVFPKQLKIHLRPIVYDDPDNKVDKISEGYNWTMDRRVYLKSHENFEYIFSLIEQSYKDVL